MTHYPTESEQKLKEELGGTIEVKFINDMAGMSQAIVYKE
jgi:hypothetical protein